MPGEMTNRELDSSDAVADGSVEGGARMRRVEGITGEVSTEPA